MPENAKALLRVVAEASVADSSAPSDTGLIILSASVEPYCYEGYVQLYVFASMQNTGEAIFQPPGNDPVIRAALEFDSVVHTGWQALPAIPPGESQDFAIEIELDRMMTADELSGLSYRGEIGVDSQQADNEYQVFDDTFPSMTCP